MRTCGDMLRFAIAFALRGARKLVRGLRQGLSEEERFRVADDVVLRLQQHGDPWRLTEDLPPLTERDFRRRRMKRPEEAYRLRGLALTGLALAILPSTTAPIRTPRPSATPSVTSGRSSTLSADALQGVVAIAPAELEGLATVHRRLIAGRPAAGREAVDHVAQQRGNGIADLLARLRGGSRAAPAGDTADVLELLLDSAQMLLNGVDARTERR